MLSIPDMAILGAAALLFFGPEQLPRVARKAGNVMREIQNTSQSFIREMERAADLHDVPPTAPMAPSAGYTAEPAAVDPYPYAPPVADPYGDEQPAPVPRGVDPYGEAPVEPPVGEKLAEPRPALGWPPVSVAAEPAPQTDHPTHV